MPSPTDNPCPSDPVDVSRPGSLVTSGCPCSRDPPLSKVLSSSIGRKLSKRHHHILSDRRMPFGKNKPVPLRPFRFFRSDLHDAKVKRHHNVHRREWPANVPGTASCNGANRQPPAFASECLQLLIICRATHIPSGEDARGGRFSSIPTLRNGLIGRWPQGSLDSSPQKRNRGNTAHPDQCLG